MRRWPLLLELASHQPAGRSLSLVNRDPDLACEGNGNVRQEWVGFGRLRDLDQRLGLDGGGHRDQHVHRSVAVVFLPSSAIGGPWLSLMCDDISSDPIPSTTH